MGRLEKLKELEKMLHNCLVVADVDKVASLARQYRETMREIAEIEGEETEADDIEKILAGRAR